MQQARHIGKIVCQMPNPLHRRPDRTYLITGGLGAIGLHTAAYLAQLGAGDIVLTSRRAPDADAQRLIEEITERYKTRIHVFAADVGEESEVVKLLERIRAELPRSPVWHIWRVCSMTRCWASRVWSDSGPPWRPRPSVPSTWTG